jgi:hypothetical protein
MSSDNLDVAFDLSLSVQTRVDARAICAWQSFCAILILHDQWAGPKEIAGYVLW